MTERGSEHAEERTRNGTNLPARRNLSDRVLPSRKGASREHTFGKRERRDEAAEKTVRARSPASGSLDRRASGMFGDLVKGSIAATRCAASDR